MVRRTPIVDVILRVSKRTVSAVLFLLVLFNANDYLAHGQVTGSSLGYFYEVQRFPGPAQDSTWVQFYISIPYSNLVFVQSGSGHKAGVTFNLFVLKDNDVYFESSVGREVEVETYADTQDDSTFLHFSEGTLLARGEYKIVTEARDKNVGLSDFHERPLIVASNRRGEIVVGDILNLNASVSPQNAAYSDLQIVPQNINRNDFYLMSEAWIPVDPSQVDLMATWFENGRKVREEPLEFVRRDNLIRIFRYYDITEIKQGHFTVEFNVSAEKLKKKTAKIDLEIFKQTQYLGEASLDLAIQQLDYIADGVIYDSLRNAKTLEAKQNWFERYWQVNFPSQDSLRNPIREEYYQRARYADRAFGNGMDGWRTDRGRIHMVYGFPDEVTNSADNRMRRYQIWEYQSIRRQFVFFDEFGSGDFRLIREY